MAKAEIVNTLPRAHPDEMECLIHTRLGTRWILRTADTLADVMRPGYFNDVLSHGLRRLDKIEVVANVKAAAPEFADLWIIGVQDHDVITDHVTPAVSAPVTKTRRAA